MPISTSFFQITSGLSPQTSCGHPGYVTAPVRLST